MRLRFVLSLGLAVALTALIGRLWARESAKTYSLASQRRTGQVARVEVALEVGGDLKLVNDGATKALPMSVVANLGYDEQLAALDKANRPTRSLRWYDDVRAVIKVDQGGEKPVLDKEHRLIAVDKPEPGAAVLYCPAGPLRREELDLIDVPGNTLLVDRLLPAGPVSPGQKWKLDDQVLAGLLGLDAVSWTDVESMLSAANGDVAEMMAGGSVSGAAGGVSTEIELKAKYRFDFKLKQVTYLALLIKEQRTVGHIGPGLDTVAKLIVKITPIAASDRLAQAHAGQLPPPKPEMSQLVYEPKRGQFSFQHDRRWFVTSDEPKLAVLRLVDRGELVAQCNVSSLPSAAKSPANLAEFQQDVERSLGKNFGQFTNASQSTNDAGYTILRVVARGVVSELPIEWIYYLVADPKGQRASLAFTFEQSLEERFAGADRVLVNQLRFIEPPSPTAARPRNQQ